MRKICVCVILLLVVTASGLAQESEPKLITLDEIATYILKNGPTNFARNGWTVKFKQLHAPQKTGDSLLVDYEATAAKDDITVSYLIRDVRREDHRSVTIEHTISIRVPWVTIWVLPELQNKIPDKH